ncbi:phosphoribosylaminoimidazolesuccinocarboxamide synthase [Paenibacillus sp. CGMCC 1.16610]|uniref:Phosphoribosylaminoimidazole-succinocarboxamide synthase n=1 Tax=Paenibacillus anseongense TaxID=2682845 RepID=A0ABW9U143_9BACL|nr:phosphoribosylaminoimidazolesuccinocarboxamide synthase [Paenibacillus sp. CGMCC 1.16610]MBA2943616.1 phosphoribosylaminoimidazolesuccinocarboxamide synthase [Paenibacillus sp. CGMCC 1.16610]MVQ33112.1 phosphoribosylaminoimidazolesuccinocarboxamide synthase [Paenibacillus anseongense]
MAGKILDSAVELVKAPLVHKGKVRELYDLGENFLIVVTDRISAFDYILKPGVPDKGYVLNALSKYWFDITSGYMKNHIVHTDVELLQDIIPDAAARELLKERIIVAKKAERISIECVVRGYITGNGWRQYEKTGEINGRKLPEGLRKNQRLQDPIFTPAAKNDVGHDEDISIEQMVELVGEELTYALQERSIMLYTLAHSICERKGIILADTKFEFGFYAGELIIIDEIFTPDSSRYWSEDKYALDIEIDSMDKEPVRTYLAGSGWDKNSEPDELPASVVEETANRYKEILHRLVDSKN